jgi:hypothetical protein
LLPGKRALAGLGSAASHPSVLLFLGLSGLFAENDDRGEPAYARRIGNTKSRMATVVLVLEKRIPPRILKDPGFSIPARDQLRRLMTRSKLHAPLSRTRTTTSTRTITIEPAHVSPSPPEGPKVSFAATASSRADRLLREQKAIDPHRAQLGAGRG